MSRGAPLSGRERVLVRLPNWLGDFVMAEPALRALEPRLAPGALTLVGQAAHLALLDGRFPGARRLALGAGARDDPSSWRGHDVALLLTGSFRSAWCAFRARIPRRVGFARDARALLLSDALVPASERGATPLELGRPGSGRRHLPRPLGRSLAELLGLLGVAVEHVEPRLDVPVAALSAARARRAQLGLDPDAPFLLANVGARADSSKGVPPELWLRALGALHARQPALTPVLCAGPGEERALEAVRMGLGAARVLVLRDPLAPLAELLGHCAEARVVWSGDTGPRHLARALGRPAVIVAGPTDPRHCAVTADERLVRVRVACGPCHLERCPVAGAEQLACMKRIDPQRLAQQTLELLGTPSILPR
ncbi:MAG: hypothetical protein EXS08_02470 [Planctomycetes bacterium]|nr:hypothetical protein [Planctomycetota bacterium]